MAKQYLHILFVVLPESNDSKNPGLIYDDTKELKHAKSRENLYHHNQQILRDQHLDQIAQFHVLNTENQYLKPNKLDARFKNCQVYFEFGQFLKAVKHSPITKHKRRNQRTSWITNKFKTPKSN